jgi:hydroxyacylglutathione hydrolase
MQLQTLDLGMLNTNCYIISNEETGETVIVDPADNASRIKDKLEEQNLIPVGILLTHGHFDHIMAVPELTDTYHIPIYISELDNELLTDSNKNAAYLIGKNFTLPLNQTIPAAETLSLAGTTIEVIPTPGHTIGSVCYYFAEDKFLISGDTLFLESVGRTDFPTGDSASLIASIREKLMILPGEVKVYPGHGSSTTIAHEKKYNPYCND